MARDQVVVGLATALRAGALTADAVALEARKAADTDTAVAAAGVSADEPSDVHAATVAWLTQRRGSPTTPRTEESAP